MEPHGSAVVQCMQFRRQVMRVAEARGLEPTVVAAAIAAVTEEPVWGIFGEPRVNVLRLNLALDEAAPLRN